MSVRFLVCFFLISAVTSCTKTLKYENLGGANKSVSAESKVRVSGDGVLDPSYIGQYTVTVTDRYLFAKSLFMSAQCSEYKMLVIKDKFALYKDSYRISMACTATFDPFDYMPFMPWEDYARHGIIYKRTYLEKTSVNSWYDIGTDFVFHTYESWDPNGKTVYSVNTLIKFGYSDLTISVSEKDIKNKETSAVVATGVKAQ